MEKGYSSVTRAMNEKVAQGIESSASTALLIQHDLLQITLNGPSLILTILVIIISIQILQPSFTCVLLALCPLPWIVRNDYQNFLSLGPGGTPSTYPYTPAIILDNIYPVNGYYNKSHAWLPERSGARPRIAGIAPQRQIDQSGCPKMYQKLRQALSTLALQRPDSFQTRISCFEKKGLALFALNPINETCRGEICHVHHSEHSLHLNLHPHDAKVVLQKGWGERHPLSRGGWMKQYVPREFVMIYAPRNETELDVVCRIIEAAGFWVAGERFRLDVES